MRHFLRTTLADRPAEERFHVMEPVLELNPEHDLVRYLSGLVESILAGEPNANSALAGALLDHLFDNALAQAGLLDDVRGLANRMTDLMTKMIQSKTETS
ncbi:unnamed protein product [Echinostoma caproni]|uniref:TetR_C_6 domain-containing protein n=1 Tax=Echinostoma caproni TaxID=27848 RepID=A0A183AUL8_9TREM|nr:unnamed protein product [Echinostoma caproni]